MIEHPLSTGTLRLDLETRAAGGDGSDAPPLFQIAERQNPKRAFLFVSTVLGRHIPVAAKHHREALDRLAERVHAELGSGPVLVMSYAETAIGLGLGVFDSLCRQAPWLAASYLPTTRLCPEGMSAWLNIREEHSHAVDHMVLPPRPGVLPRDTDDATLVLVDDETTTGNTFKGLAEALDNAGFTPPRLLLVTLTDWSGQRALATLHQALPHALISTVSLLSGHYTWTPTPGCRPRSLPPGRAPDCPAWRPLRDARFAVPRQGLDADDLAADKAAWAQHLERHLLPRLAPASRVLVIGTGEHVWHPFLAAEQLERHGHLASLIATTRSPVAPGDVIRHQLSFSDHYGLGITMYLNNVNPNEWDEIVLFTETGFTGIPEALISGLGRCHLIDHSHQPVLLTPCHPAMKTCLDDPA